MRLVRRLKASASMPPRAAPSLPFRSRFLRCQPSVFTILRISMTDFERDEDLEFPRNVGQFVMTWSSVEHSTEGLLGAILNLDQDL